MLSKTMTNLHENSKKPFTTVRDNSQKSRNIVNNTSEHFQLSKELSLKETNNHKTKDFKEE